MKRSTVLHAALLLIACSSVVLTGCDVGSPEYQLLDAPSLHLLDATLTGVDAMGNLTTITLTPDSPAGGPTDLVHSTSSLRLRFDRFLLPGTAIRQSICLQPNSTPVVTLDQCTLGVSLEPSYDPVRRIVTYRLPANAELKPDTRYWLTILAPSPEVDLGFKAFDGAALEQTIAMQFSTAVTNPGGPVDPSPEEPARLAKSEELFCFANDCTTACGMDALCKSRCAVSKSLVSGCGYCHGRLEAGSAVMGLDLSGPERISSLIGRVANQTQTGGNADEPESKPRRFGRAMPHIEAGNPGNSYLLYKVLVSPAFDSTRCTTGTEIGCDLAPGELDRLRASVVVGLPMPPYESAGIGEAGVEVLREWITTGAQTPACP